MTNATKATNKETKTMTRLEALMLTAIRDSDFHDGQPKADHEEVRYYTATGSVRGDCGHAHRTIAGAEKCRRRDSRVTALLPASPHGRPYSDRVVVV